MFTNYIMNTKTFIGATQADLGGEQSSIQSNSVLSLLNESKLHALETCIFLSYISLKVKMCLY